jgi:subtilase family serine protease
VHSFRQCSIAAAWRVRDSLSNITITFRRTPEHRASLDRLLADLQNSSSLNHHKSLTPEQFGERFGAAVENMERVAEWLRSQDFQASLSAAAGDG